ncbi:Uncharacterised protein [Candidatus Tiddalikarchaeum anstoanum]|nr:Uncharacterised protein [Candidatus Tiddalikarchaeum anstoanum]
MVDEKKEKNNLDNMYGEDYDLALKFANRVYPEFSGVIKSVIFFGSGAVKKEHRGDIDILIVFNDAEVVSDNNFKIYFQKQINESIMKTSDKLHVNTVTLTVFWENLINGEPVVFNVLRDGIPIIDTGFFSPLKVLLLKGRLRPSAEAILNLASRVETHKLKGLINLLSAAQELYLSALDASQSTLMAYGQVPPSPDKVPLMLKGIKVDAKSVKLFVDLQKLFKKIEHRDLTKITGKDYDAYLKKTISFNKVMEDKLKKKI